MDIELMHEFVVFSRYLNFSRAAGKLNLTQPTLSSHVAAMEKELGFDLVQRGRGARLTPAGKRFCAEAERIVRDYAALVDGCRDIAARQSGALVFERPIRQGGIDREFDSILCRFREANPTIVLRKQETQDRTIREVLSEGISDVVFAFNDSIELYDQEFADEIECLPAPERKRGPYYLWLDSSHHLASFSSVKLDQLDGCTFLIPSSIRYQSLESLAVIGGDITGSSVSCTYWPGSYEECILNIRPDEIMIVNDEDLHEPAYSLVPNRRCVLLEGVEDLIRPCFAFLKSNENPALETFEHFLKEESQQTAEAC